MSALYLLPLLAIAQLAAEAPARREPPVRFGPCGVYDLAELSDHFLVTVDQQPAEFDPELRTITIALVEPESHDDKRQPLPTEGLALQVKDEAGKPIASTPLHWETQPYAIAGKKSQYVRLTLSPKAAKQTILNREPALRFLDQPHLLVTFKSLAK